MCKGKLLTGNFSRAAPHLTTFDGVRFDFLGEHGANYTVFSVRRRIPSGIKVNLRTPMVKDRNGYVEWHGESDNYGRYHDIRRESTVMNEVHGDHLVTRMRGSPFWTHGMKATFFNAFALSRFNPVENRTDEILVELGGGGSASSSENAAVHVIVNGSPLTSLNNQTNSNENSSVTIDTVQSTNKESLDDATLRVSVITDPEENNGISSITLVTPDAEYIISVQQLNRVTRHLDIHLHLRHTPIGDVHFYDGLLGHSLNRLLHPSSFHLSRTDERAPPFEIERDIFGDDLELALRARFSTATLFSRNMENRNERNSMPPASYFQELEEGEGDDVQDIELKDTVDTEKDKERERERENVMQYYWNHRRAAGFMECANLTGKNLTASIVDLDF